MECEGPARGVRGCGCVSSQVPLVRERVLRFVYVRLTLLSFFRQIYDSKDNVDYPEGKAIIAYCEAKGCNKGALGNNEGGEERAVHSGMSVGYSGFVCISVPCLFFPLLLSLFLSSNSSFPHAIPLH